MKHIMNAAKVPSQTFNVVNMLCECGGGGIDLSYETLVDCYIIIESLPYEREEDSNDNCRLNSFAEDDEEHYLC